MRKIILLFALLLTNLISAQIEDVITGLNGPNGIVFNGNELFISEYNANKISKIDITDNNPITINVVTGLNGSYGLLINGNNLYIVEHNGNKISEIDITDNNPTITAVVTGLNNPATMVLNGNELYITEYSGNKISKIDITDSNPIATDVITGLANPDGMAIRGNELFFSERAGNKISKIDITDNNPIATDVIVGLDSPIGIVLYGDELYIAEYTGNKISKIDVTDNNPIATDVVTGLNGPANLAFNGNDLYIVEHNGNKISKFIILPPPVSSTFCSDETPLPIDPPTSLSTLAAVTDTGSPADTGLIGPGLGEYSIASVDLNLQHGYATNLIITLQSPDGTTLVLSDGNGGNNGLDTAADLVFTDASTNNITGWTGGAPMADYNPEEGDFASTFDGEDINGDWYIIVEDDYVGGADGTLNSYCVTFSRSIGDSPEIFCPADFAVDNDEGVCGAVVNFAPPIAIDNEDGVLDPSNVVQTGGITTGGFFPVGDNLVTFTATDSHLNETSCSFTITILDTEDTVAVCQDITVTLDASGNGSIVAADLDGGSTDNCAVTSWDADQTSFDCSDVGDVTVTLTVFDDAGNASSCDATVTVVDDMAPIVTCIGAPGSSTYTEGFEGASVPAGWSTIIVNGGWDWTFGSNSMPGTDDFPTNAAIFDDDAAGGGPNHVASLLSPVYDMTGAIGATLSFDYALGDYAGSGLLRVEVYDGAAWQEVFLADDADIPPTNSGAIDVFAYANANFQVQFTYDDENSGWNWGAGVDNFSLTVDTPPAPPLEIALGADGMASIPAGDLIINVDEACGYTVTSGGTSACSQSNPGNGFENGLFNNGAPFSVANDFVANGDFTLTQISMNLFHDIGATIDNVVFTYYEDAAGLPGAVIGTETAVPTSQTVVGSNFGFDVSDVVFDITPVDFADVSGTGTTYWVGTLATSTSGGTTAWEVSTASSLGNEATNSGDGGVTWGPGGAGDGVYTFSGVCGGTDPNNFNFDCSNLGENVVEVFVTDNSGNTSSCFATVVIVDTIAPVLVCQDTTIELGEDGTATVDPLDLLLEATDNCGIDVLIADLEEVSCADIGTPIDVTVLATDANGNVSSCTLVVTVVDTMAPVISCPADDSIELDFGGTHSLGDYIADGSATVTDNCTDPVTIFTQDPVAGTVLGFGVHTITFTAEDEYGNVATCSFELTLTEYLSNNDNELGNAVSMYPNPARNLVTITNSSNISLDNAMMYDINGKLIAQINLQEMQSEKVIDVSEFATGVYMVQITGEQASVVKRLIKK